jgi:hypothetical protein
VAERVSLVRADARALDDQAHGPYSIALIPLNTLAHLATLADRLAVLEATRARLAPGARLALDVDLEGPRRLLSAPGQLWHLGTWDLPTEDPTDSEAVTSVSHFVSAERVATGGVAVTHFYDALTRHGEVRRSMTRMALAMLTPDEVHLMLERVGFIVEAIYGSYDLDPFEPGDERAIFIAHSRPSS